MPPSGPERLSALDLVEGLQLARAVATLHDHGVLEFLRQPASAEKVAGIYGFDADLLRGVLEYIAARTTLITRKGKRFVATADYGRQSRYLLDLYGLAFGGNAAQLGAILKNPKVAPGAVDRLHHARAFIQAGPQFNAMPMIVRQLELERVLDLGCGPAAMLVDLAQNDPAFIGWGLERNPRLCREARANLRKVGASKRVRILEGDAMRIATSLPRDVAKDVRTVTASQFVNELFGKGPSLAIRWLRALRRALPGRTLLIADYYGRLGTHDDAPRELLLHDYAQLISGQGVPPPDLAGWNALYTEAGCRLAHAIEDNNTTLFVHVVVL